MCMITAYEMTYQLSVEVTVGVETVLGPALMLQTLLAKVLVNKNIV